MQLVVVGHALVHDAPEFFEGLGAFGTPPEPAAGRLVQGAPQHRQAGRLKLLQLHGNNVDVADEQLVPLAVFVGQGRGWSKVVARV